MLDDANQRQENHRKYGYPGNTGVQVLQIAPGSGLIYGHSTHEEETSETILTAYANGITFLAPPTCIIIALR